MESLEKYFEIAFAAPDGIQKLRELILTLAMQGKLVPQDPDDQPASELLKEIEAEKLRLVKEGKIKPSKPLPEIKPEEVPYELPKGWEWVQVRNVCHDWGQKKPDKLFTYIDVGSIDNKRGLIGNQIQLLESFEAPSRARKIVRQGTIIYSTVRPYLLNIAIVDRQFAHEPIASTAFAILHPFCQISTRFIYYYLRSPAFINYVESMMKGVAYPAISDGDFFQGHFPLPPLAEQHRIVAKIDQLMARCDELEKLRNDRNQKQITVHTAALNRLLTAQQPDDFNAAWRFITQHFGELYTVKPNVAELRKAILQLAVMGKLVPQNPTDPPASELLKEIEAEKLRLVKEGKIKPSKPLPEIKPEEVPYEVPKGWEWSRLGDIIRLQNGFAFKSTDYTSHGIRLIRNVNISHGFIDYKDVAYYADAERTKYQDFELCQGDILISLDRPIISTGLKIAILTEHDVPSLLVQRVGRIRGGLLKIKSLFLFNWFQSSLFIDRIAPGRSNGVPHISTKEVEMLLLPIPPIAEQHRIVAKIDQLMALCDQLEQQIDAATSKQTALLNALMAEMPPTSPTSGGL